MRALSLCALVLCAVIAEISFRNANGPNADAAPFVSRLDEAVAFIRRDAAFAAQERSFQGESSRQYLTALATMNYVQSRVSSTQYGYLAKWSPKQVPTTDQACLTSGAGICGNQVSVFLNLAKRLDLRARSVEFYWKSPRGVPSSHVAAEVEVGDRWEFFDVTWGTVYKRDAARSRGSLEALSIAELMALPNPRAYRITNESVLAYQCMVAAGFDAFEYLDHAKSVIVGKEGVIHSSLDDDVATGVSRFVPAELPAYVGVAADYSTGHLGNLALELSSPRAVRSVTMKTTAAICVRGGQLQVVQGASSASVPLKTGAAEELALTLDETEQTASPLTLRVQARDQTEPCYVAFSEIVAR